MTTAIGRLATSVAAKFGLCTRKAAIRLATETGYKLVDEAQKLGRDLTAKEIESVFEKTLPKKLRPKLLGSREEIKKMYIDLGTNEQIAHAIAYNPVMKGGCIPAGAGKRPIFVDKGDSDYLTNTSFFAHELEHALETNNRLKGVILRKIGGPILAIKSLFNKNYINDIGDINKIFQNKIQVYGLQMQNKTAVTEMQKFDINGKVQKEFITTLDCEPTREGIMAMNGLSEARYMARNRDILRQFANGKTYGSQNKFRLNFMKNIIDLEIPAYTVGGKVQEYAYKLGKGQIGAQTGTAIVYKDALKIIKGEKRLYLKNKFLGRLKKPSVYHSDKDIIRLVKKSDDKLLVKRMIKSMDVSQKRELFDALRKNPNSLENIKTLREALKVDGRYIYDNYLGQITNINPKMLENPDFVKIATIIMHDEPAFAYMLEKIAKANPKRIREFAKIADKKILVDGKYEELKYYPLSHCIESKNFDLLKRFAEIEISGNRYANYVVDMDILLKPEQIEAFYKKALSGKNVTLEIEEAIQTAAKARTEAAEVTRVVKVENSDSHKFFNKS